jgi:DNA modification methylase
MVKLTLIHGDALKVLPTIPSESIDIIITDPPFMISKEDKITRSKNPNYKFKANKDINLYFGDWDVFESEEKYLEFTYKWLSEAWRTLRKGGHLLTFFDKFKITYLVNWVKEHDGIPRQPLFWIIQNPVPKARKINLMNAVVMIFWATKHTTSRKYATFNYELGQHPDYKFAPLCMGKERYSYGFHPTQKPESIIKWIMEYLSKKGDTVLDPFLGSGTTMKVAKDLERNCIGIEINEEYINITKKRLNWGHSLGNIEWEFIKF